MSKVPLFRFLNEKLHFHEIRAFISSFFDFITSARGFVPLAFGKITKFYHKKQFLFILVGIFRFFRIKSSATREKPPSALGFTAFFSLRAPIWRAAEELGGAFPASYPPRRCRRSCLSRYSFFFRPSYTRRVRPCQRPHERDSRENFLSGPPCPRA